MRKKISVGDGFVVELRFSTRGGVALKGCGKFVQRLKRRVLEEISKGETDVVGVVKFAGKGIGFETVNEVVVGHGDWPSFAQNRHFFPSREKWANRVLIF